jgi:ankyrin repeat protein
MAGHFGGVAALLSAAAAGNVHQIKCIISSGISVNALNERDDSALHYAAKNGHAAAVEALVRAGARLNSVNIYQQTALYGAAEWGHVEVMEALVRCGASIHLGDPLLAAIRRGHVAAVEALVRLGAPLDASGADGWYALHSAAFHGQAAVVDALLALGADPTARVSCASVLYSGFTALQIAEQRGFRPVAASLRQAEVRWRSAGDLSLMGGLGWIALRLQIAAKPSCVRSLPWDCVSLGMCPCAARNINRTPISNPKSTSGRLAK